LQFHCGKPPPAAAPSTMAVSPIQAGREYEIRIRPADSR
jgi:hypothetical protein